MTLGGRGGAPLRPRPPDLAPPTGALCPAVRRASSVAMLLVRRMRLACLIATMLIVSTRGVPELAEALGHTLVAALADGAGDAADGSETCDPCADGCGDSCLNGLYHMCECGAPALGVVADAPRLTPRLTESAREAPEASPGIEFPGFVEPPFRPPLA